MSIILDHRLREQLQEISTAFPIIYFHDEMVDQPGREGPVHWHPEFEIATAKTGVLDYQVGGEHVFLEPGDSIFVNTNMLHGIRQVSGDIPDPMPGIVFSGSLIAPEGSLICQKYLRRISACDRLPFAVFRRGTDAPVHRAVRNIYHLLSEASPFYELGVQRELIGIFEYLNRHLDQLTKTDAPRVPLDTQIRVQQMLSFLFAHYAENITLSDISAAASISRSEAGRCFSFYVRDTPIDYLIKYRLQRARALLVDSSLSIQEICLACGFHSVNYFTRRFRLYYGHTPGAVRKSGK